jgi:predicted nucleic acid-binding protein
VIVVDTSIWVGILNDTDVPIVARARELIEQDAPIALTDVILTEVLQGLRRDEDVSVVETYLGAFPILRLADLDDFRVAASLYRTARRTGITVRKTLDCLIAASCIRADAPIMHADTDFDRLASCTPLQVFDWTERAEP